MELVSLLVTVAALGNMADIRYMIRSSLSSWWLSLPFEHWYYCDTFNKCVQPTKCTKEQQWSVIRFLPSHSMETGGIYSDNCMSQGHIYKRVNMFNWWQKNVGGDVADTRCGGHQR
jgi:hypothetical protein